MDVFEKANNLLLQAYKAAGEKEHVFKIAVKTVYPTISNADMEVILDQMRFMKSRVTQEETVY